MAGPITDPFQWCVRCLQYWRVEASPPVYYRDGNSEKSCKEISGWQEAVRQGFSPYVHGMQFALLGVAITTLGGDAVCKNHALYPFETERGVNRYGAFRR